MDAIREFSQLIFVCVAMLGDKYTLGDSFSYLGADSLFQPWADLRIMNSISYMTRLRLNIIKLQITI